MKVEALDPGALLAKLGRVPAAPYPRPKSGGACAPGRAVPPRGAGSRPPRPVSAAVERESGGRIGAKGVLITLPDIGEEAAAESDGDAVTCSPPRPRKGLSRGSTNQCLSGKSGESLPAVFEKNVQEAIDNYTRETLPSFSSSGCTTPTELNNSWSGINSYTTGLSTERSSVYSWRDDEFDRANTQRVHQLLWEIDELLFEGKVTSQTQSLQAECADWSEQFPHIRVLGKQLLLPKDEGFQHFQSRSDTCVDTVCLSDLHECTSNIKQLCISGSKLIPTPSPIHKSPDPSSTRISDSDSSMYSFLEEEIYDVDGKIEEYLAFDNKELDDEDWEQKKMRLAEKRSKRGIPPVSPDACIKDAVVSEVFDCIWSNVIGILEELIKKNWEVSIPECDKQVEKLKTVTAKLPHLPVIRLATDAGSVPLSRGSQARTVSFGSHFVSSQARHFSSNFCSDLNGVMTIQAKPLQQRHVATVEKIQNEQEDKQYNIGSCAPNSVHTRLGRIADKSVLSSSRVLLASSRKLPSHRRLPSLTSDQLSSKAPNMYNDEILRGTKLVASLDHLSSVCASTTRNKLPPINSGAVEQCLSVPRLQLSSHRGRYGHSRVSSAVPGSTELQPLRERTVIDQISRPNTTHAFRTDTPQKRSLTPMDFPNHRGTGQRSLIGSQHYYRSFQRNTPTSRKRFQISS
ncbi:protein FAM149A isoform X2 [Melanerpes formicivorus]|uniref:protein FAM149A isoform X2 n=1 Tax=Melanerpes formicivorus TaxID=211600 RepID=UPI00358E8E7B